MNRRGPDGECLRCLVSLIFSPEEAPASAGSPANGRSVSVPPRYAHFEIELGADGFPAELGAGAMAVTYRAHDTILHSVVALKVIDRQVAENPIARKRFLREARAAAQLHHPNVARVTYYGEQDGECFYVMEYVEGVTLEERVRREGPLAPAMALEVILQAARALAAAEVCGVVHRDIKPSNLMIAARQGEAGASDSLVVKMIDFGVAKMTEAGADQTQAGFVGTPAFASPEQFAAAGETPVDTRSDIYSLGITFWYLLAGRAPFTGRTLEEIRAKHGAPLPFEQLAEAKVPVPMLAVLKSMLAVDPAQRPPTARALLASLHECTRLGRETLVGADLVMQRGDGFWVAVLPFRFHDSGPEIAAFSEGLTEEIVTGLARFTYLRVIAQSSTSRYRTEPADVRRIGQDLGARYVVQGSLRQVGRKLRIAVRLLDAHSGAHVWAETFERDLEHTDIFELQDSVAHPVVAAIADVYGVLARPLAALAGAQAPETLTPYQAVWRFFLAQQRGSAEDHLLARIALERAVELQPGYAEAWAALAIVLVDEDRHVFNPRPNSLARALRAAERAIDADPASQMARYAYAGAQYFSGDLGAFRSAAERALTLNPLCSYALAYVGRLFCNSGDWDRGLKLANRAIDLCPHHPGWYLSSAFLNEYRQRHYPEALAVLQRMNMPDYWVARYYTAITQAQLGNRAAAAAEVQRTLRVWPEFEQAFGLTYMHKWLRNQSELIEHIMEGVRLAGFQLRVESE